MQPDESGGCPECGSPNVVAVDGDYYTGVESDGYRERWRYFGWRCLECGAEDELD